MGCLPENYRGGGGGGGGGGGAPKSDLPSSLAVALTQVVKGKERQLSGKGREWHSISVSLLQPLHFQFDK